MAIKKSRSYRKQAIVLLSGGLDSAVSLYFAKKKGFICRCLIFDYGQRHSKELESAELIAKAANCSRHVLKIKLPWKGSSLLDRKRTLIHQARAGIPSTYVPARNIIFLSFALSFAEAIGARAIFIGAHTQDYSGYPDCRKEFFKAFSKVIEIGTRAGVESKRIKLAAPLIRMSKSEIIKLGMELGVPFELTRSCYEGGRMPCGKCDSCRFRAKGFAEAGIPDPIY